MFKVADPLRDGRDGWKEDSGRETAGLQGVV